MKIILLVGCVMILCVSHVHAQCSADAGQDFYICGNMALLTGTVSGNTGAVVTWSCPVAGVTFSNPGAAVTNVVFSSQVPQGTSIPLVLTEYITVPSCIATDTVLVIIYQPQYPLPLVDPADSINCGRVTTHLAAQQPSYGVGYWYDSAALTQFYPDNYSNNPDSVVITSSAYGTHHFYWVTVNGTCRDTSEVVSITFYEQPVANAGGNYWSGLFGTDSQIKTDTACGLCYPLHASSSGFQGMWFSTDPNIHFTSTGAFNDSVCVTDYSVYTSPGYRDLIWITDNHSCTDKDTLRLFFAPRPSGNFTTTMPFCRYECSTLLAYTWPLPGNIDYGLTTFYWDLGGGTLCYPLDIQHSDTLFVYWTSDTAHQVTLITENQWGCRSTIIQHTVYEPPLFNPGYAINPASCGNCNGEIILSTENNSFCFEWFDTGMVNPFDTIRYNLCGGSSFQIVVEGLSLSPDAYPGTFCYDTISVTMTSASPPVADFETGNYSDITFPFSLFLLNQSQNANQYKWIVTNDTGYVCFTSSIENPVFLITDPGCYNIKLIVKQNPDSSWLVGIARPPCYDTTEYYNLCLWPSYSSVIAYPNPMSGYADVYIGNPGTGNSAVNYRIFSTTGNTMVYGYSELPANKTFRISRGNLNPGLYYLEVTAGKVYRAKLLVE